MNDDMKYPINRMAAIGLAACVPVFDLRAATRYVALDSPHPAPPYNSWVTAAQSLQPAIAAAEAGDAILVTNGVYRGGVTLTNQVVLRSVNGPRATVIDGQQAAACVWLSEVAVVSGFTLTNGLDNNHGGGVNSSRWDLNAPAFGVVTNCIITGNASGSGGGVYGATVYNCIITNNSAIYGGGGADSSTLYNCLLMDNRATLGDGGGAYYCSLFNCTLTRNTALWVDDSNAGPARGGYGGGTGGGALRNCIVVANIGRPGHENASGCAFTNSCTTPLPQGPGNLDRDPRFINAAAGDLRLREDSPCIGVGGANYTEGVDLDGQPWLNPPAMGAYEFIRRSQAPTITVNPASHTNVVGGTVQFKVTAAGSEPFSYQWLKNDTSIAGATNASLVISSIAISDAGSYAVLITNLQGSVTSAPAFLVCVPIEADTGPTSWVRQFGLGTVNGATFSAYGEFLLTYGGFGAYLWMVNDGKIVRRFPGDRGAAISSDGTMVLTGNNDGTARLWSVGDGSLLRTLAGSPGNVAFSADGMTVLAGNKLWSARDGSMIHTFTNYVTDLSPDGTKILTVEGPLWFTYARLWTAGGVGLRDFPGMGTATHPDPIQGAVFSPDGTQVLTVGEFSQRPYNDAAKVRLTSILGGSPSMTFEGRMVRGNCMALSPNRTTVLTAGGDGKAKLWAVADGRLLRTFAGSALALSPDGTKVAALSEDYTLKLWSARDGALGRSFKGYSEGVNSVAFSPDGTRVLAGSGSEGGAARLWSLGDGTELRTFTGLSNAVWWVAFSPDGSKLVTSRGYYTNAATGGALHSVGIAELWSAAAGKLLQSFPDTNFVYSLAFSPDGTRLLAGGYSTDGHASYGVAKLWSIGDGALLLSLEGDSSRVRSVAYSPDGMRLLTGGDDKTAKLWLARDGTLLRTFAGHSNAVNSVAFSPDGTEVLTGSGDPWGAERADNTAKLWSARDGSLLRTFAGHSNSVNRVAFSPDGSKVLTGSGDWTAKLWSARDGTLLQTFTGHLAGVTSVAFSPDGMRVLTGSFDGTVLLWNVSASNPPAPRILSAAMLAPNGPFQIRLQGETGVSYRLEGSTNLLNWTSLITTHLTTGEWEWNDPQSPPLSQRFYRAVLP